MSLNLQLKVPGVGVFADEIVSRYSWGPVSRVHASRLSDFGGAREKGWKANEEKNERHPYTRRRVGRGRKTRLPWEDSSRTFAGRPSMATIYSRKSRKGGLPSRVCIFLFGSSLSSPLVDRLAQSDSGLIYLSWGRSFEEFLG